jgi:prepilin-type N-terminal cleavage/methylation domain-containing protein
MHRLRTDESGFGLIELVIAMVILSVGILALASAFTSGSIALNRASRTATATAIADAQLERYRAIRYCAIHLEPGTVPPVGSGYWTGFTGPLVTARGASCPDVVPTQAVTARQDLLPAATPDGHRYRVDTYIVEAVPDTNPLPPGSPAAYSQLVKKVTVVVRDWSYLSKSLVRQTSTFHLATGS